MAGTLKSGVADAAGAWRVAPLPTFEAGEKASATNGGGSFALLEQSKHKLAAAAFQKFISVGEGADITQASGSFPARTSVLASDDFLAQQDDYFGGQEINRVFVDSLAAVRPGWRLPRVSAATAHQRHGHRVAGLCVPVRAPWHRVRAHLDVADQAHR